MDKATIRKQIRELKKAMTAEEIQQSSEKLGELFLSSELYRQAKTIYGYLPYNQEVRTTPILARAGLRPPQTWVIPCWDFFTARATSKSR